MNGAGAGPKVAVGCGTLLMILAVFVAAFGAFHVFIDPHGAISADEAAPALVGGLACMFVDFLIVAIGAALWMRGGSAPGGAPQMGGGASMPGAPAAQQAFPWHLVSGCGSLFFVLTLCLSLGGALYAYSEMERWESMRSSDIAMGEDPLLIMIDDGAIEENQQKTGAGACCCGLSFVLALACAGGTFALVRRRRAAGA
jgi:hypothetical protein